MDREALTRLLAESPFASEYGMIVEHASPGRVRVQAPFREHYVRPGGVIPGFIYMAIADVVTWLAVLSLIGEIGDLAVTTEMRTSFLSALRGEPFWCDAEIVDPGERLLFATATCRDARDAILTHSTLTYIRPPARR